MPPANNGLGNKSPNVHLRGSDGLQRKGHNRTEPFTEGLVVSKPVYMEGAGKIANHGRVGFQSPKAAHWESKITVHTPWLESWFYHLKGWPTTVLHHTGPHSGASLQMHYYWTTTNTESKSKYLETIWLCCNIQDYDQAINLLEQCTN